ncbi:MAG TPA: methionine--tRNA ligase, partial [Nitrososphaeria archaeon]|nr:methionine--tRNA ligase [Nitrososphaeria archaeon]
MAQVDFSDFQKLDIRIGRVISAERVEGATKLLKLTVDFGQYRKQSIAGLGHIYDPEYFVGKQFAFVVNLK